MAHPIKTISVIFVFPSLFLLLACGSSTPTSTPTVDLNPIRTEVAATVVAQVTQTICVAPSATPIPSPTATVTPLSMPTQAGSVAPSPQVTITVGAPVTGTVNLAAWVSQTIPDGSIFAPGETFTVTWRLRNTGTSTWTVAYLLRFYSGDTFGAPKEVPLGRAVLPGETVDITIPMSAPAIAGNYRSDWVMSDENRYNFKEPIFLKITVALPATPTPTATSGP